MNEKQIARYSRQIILPEVGGKGQEKLLNAKVLVIGAGGLGSPSAVYLARAGVGRLGIVDSDVVEISNLHRQILFSTDDIGKKKTIAGCDYLRRVNPDIEIISHDIRLNSENISEIIRDYDIVIDGSDNFPTRFLVNDACVFEGKPLIHGSFFRFEGQVIVINPGEGPCYRCIFPESPPPGEVPSCQQAGVLGALAGIIGLIQATEALKLILGIGDSPAGKLIIFDALQMNFRKIKTLKDENCTACRKNTFKNESIQITCSGT